MKTVICGDALQSECLWFPGRERCIRDPRSVHLVTERHCLFSQCLSLACSARLLTTTIVFGAGVPREASCLPVLWTELPVWTEGVVDHLFISSSAWKEIRGNSLHATGSLRSVIVISMCLMSRLAHRNTYLGEGNNREKGTSNDNDYYYCSEDVGKVVNQPHAECFSFICLAACNLPVEGALYGMSSLMTHFLIRICCPWKLNS